MRDINNESISIEIRKILRLLINYYSQSYEIFLIDYSFLII